MLIFTFTSSICFAQSEFPVNFMMQADVTPINSGFKIESVVTSPNKITVRYDVDNKRFNDAHSTLIVETNIPEKRKESFYYDIYIIKNKASCLLNSGKIIPYDTPTLEITNNDGVFVEINTVSPMRWQNFDDVISNKKASIKDINISFSTIPVTDFINNYKNCAGEVTLIVGLSI
ncbi:hypothetical protein CTM67_20305 [Photobacterium phosphoreum]|nr:hypothetical protein CTM67_20305 [Photobacterium phosphoreum]